MAEPHRLTLHDQFVINALIYLSAGLTVSDSELRAVVTEMAVQLKSCNWHNPQMEPVLSVARDFVEANGKPDPLRRERLFDARLRAQGILTPFALWRMGLIQAAIAAAPKAEAAA